MSGSFAKTWFQLYAKETVIGVLVGVGFVVFLIFLVHKLIRHLPHRNSIVDAKKNAKDPAVLHTNMFRTVLIVGASFFSSVCAARFTVVIYMIFMFLETAYYTQFNLFIVLILILIAFVVYPALIFGPALVIGMKKGSWWGVGTFVLTIVWLCFYLFIFFMYLFFVRAHRDPSYPVYMRGATAPSVQLDSAQ